MILFSFNTTITPFNPLPGDRGYVSWLETVQQHTGLCLECAHISQDKHTHSQSRSNPSNAQTISTYHWDNSHLSWKLFLSLARERLFVRTRTLIVDTLYVRTSWHCAYNCIRALCILVVCRHFLLFDRAHICFVSIYHVVFH